MIRNSDSFDKNLLFDLKSIRSEKYTVKGKTWREARGKRRSSE